MISLYRYQLPFKQPFALAGMTLLGREGLVLRYENGSVDIYSEIAPLPGFSLESTDDVVAQVKHHVDAICERLDQNDITAWNVWLMGQSFPPSVRFGLDIMMHQVMAARTNTTLQQYVNSNACESIGMNAVLGIISPSELELRTTQLVGDGYRTIKYKVGDPRPCLDTWLRLRKKFPELKMRFDANGSWMPDQSESWAKLLEPVNPEYLEQPLPVGYETEMCALQNQINYPIAFDESARDIESIRSIMKITPNSVIILKPMLLGSIAELSNIIASISVQRAAFTITTLIESGIGRNIVASIAAAFAHPDVDHGIGTGSLFDDDILKDLTIEDGRFMIDTNPVSRINSALLETFRIL